MRRFSESRRQELTGVVDALAAPGDVVAAETDGLIKQQEETCSVFTATFLKSTSKNASGSTPLAYI